MLAITRNASRLLTWAGGAALILVALIVSLEVILRKLFLVSLNLGAEMSSYVLAIGTSWAFAFALFERSHVRVDAAVRLLPIRVAAWTDLLALAALTWYAGLLLWHGFIVLLMSWGLNARAMTPLATPLWIPQGLWVLGLAMFAFAAVLLTVRAAFLLMQRRYEDSRALIGTASVESGAEAEIGRTPPSRTASSS